MICLRVFVLIRVNRNGENGRGFSVPVTAGAGAPAAVGPSKQCGYRKFAWRIPARKMSGENEHGTDVTQRHVEHRPSRCASRLWTLLTAAQACSAIMRGSPRLEGALTALIRVRESERSHYLANLRPPALPTSPAGTPLPTRTPSDGPLCPTLIFCWD